MSRTDLARSFLSILTWGVLAAAGACGSIAGPGERVFVLEVAESRAPCMGEGTTECLRVRERADVPFSLFYSSITGFVWEPGYHYVLEVRERPIANPPADGAIVEWILIRIISKTRL